MTCVARSGNMTKPMIWRYSIGSDQLRSPQVGKSLGKNSSDERTLAQARQAVRGYWVGATALSEAGFSTSVLWDDTISSCPLRSRTVHEKMPRRVSAVFLGPLSL